MSSNLDLKDLDEKVRDKVYVQDYNNKIVIEGIKIVEVKNNLGEDSDFSEVMRFNDQGESVVFPGFKIRQINRTKLLPHSIKAWHLHLKQDEIWFVLPRFQILACLWDLRKNSPTKGQTMRIPLGGGISQLLFIPKGVAHGSLNISEETASMLYFVDHEFDPKNPDEQRLNWDSLGADFWKPKRD